MAPRTHPVRTPTGTRFRHPAPDARYAFGRAPHHAYHPLTVDRYGVRSTRCATRPSYHCAAEVRAGQACCATVDGDAAQRGSRGAQSECTATAHRGCAASRVRSRGHCALPHTGTRLFSPRVPAASAPSRVTPLRGRRSDGPRRCDPVTGTRAARGGKTRTETRTGLQNPQVTDLPDEAMAPRTQPVYSAAGTRFAALLQMPGTRLGKRRKMRTTRSPSTGTGAQYPVRNAPSLALRSRSPGRAGLLRNSRILRCAASPNLRSAQCAPSTGSCGALRSRRPPRAPVALRTRPRGKAEPLCAAPH